MTKLEKLRDELKPSDLHMQCNDNTCAAHKSWKLGFDACLRALQSASVEFDEVSAKADIFRVVQPYLRDMISRGRACEMALQLLKEQHQQMSAQVAALRAEIERLNNILKAFGHGE